MTAFEPGRERGLDGRRRRVSPRATAFRASRPGPDHHGRVRGVRARGDRGDRDRAGPDRRPLAADLDRDGPVAAVDRRGPAPAVGLAAAGASSRASAAANDGGSLAGNDSADDVLDLAAAGVAALDAGVVERHAGRSGSSSGSCRGGRSAGPGPAAGAGRRRTARPSPGRARGPRRSPARRPGSRHRPWASA